MDTQNHNDSFDAISVDMDGDALEYQPMDNWLARVTGKPTAESSTTVAPRAIQTPTSLPENMAANQIAIKIDRLNKKFNELEGAVYYMKEEISELQEKKMQLNQELAGLSNAKSAIKTINQRLNTIQFGFSRILDRVEVIEKKDSLDDVVRSTATNGAPEFAGLSANDTEVNLSLPGHPLAVLNSGANRRGRNKRKAVDHGDRPFPTPSVSGGGGSQDEIAKMEEILAQVVKRLSELKMQSNEENLASTGPTASPSVCDTTDEKLDANMLDGEEEKPALQI